MFLALVLIAGIVTLIAVLQYRAVLSFNFPEIEGRFLGKDAKPPESVRALFEEAFEELSQLGFRGPTWVLNTEHAGNSVNARLQAALHHRQSGTVAWLSSPIDLNHPNRLLIYFTSQLDDGRFTVTQVEDPYFEALKDPQTPAQTVKADDFEPVIDKHHAFVESLGVSVDRGHPKHHVETFSGEWQRNIRHRLLHAGRLQLENGIARPTLGFGLRILITYHRRPKSPTSKQSIPASRLTELMSTLKRAQSSAPARSHEWFLFLASAGLSLAIGTPILGFELTAILLGVIAFHELGHYAAMRAFGYSNTHMTFLPLLGGVTIGHENDPDPAKRAWVSLAGPLPGIIIGWALLIWLLFGNGMAVAPPWTMTLAWVLLAVNYLNVLPIPPLDGSHVVRALLPPRFLKLQTLFILAGIALAVALGIAFGFWIITIIALLQVFTLSGVAQVNRTVRAMQGGDDNGQSVRGPRLRGVLEKMEALFGAATQAKNRLGHAQEALNLLRMRRFSPIHRAVVGTVFAALLVVPAAGIAVGMGLVPLFSSYTGNVDYETQVAEYEQLEAKWQGRARERSMTELVAGLETYGEPPGAPASQAQLQAASQRLGRFPSALESLYLAANGIPALNLRRVQDIVRLANDDTAREWLSYGVYGGTLSFNAANGDGTDWFDVPLEATENWWVLGPTDNGDQQVYWAPDGLPGHPEYQLVVYFAESPVVYSDPESWLRESWIAQKVDEDMQGIVEQRRTQARGEFQDASISELTRRFPEPTLFERMLGNVEAWPDGAGPETLDALEQQTDSRLDPTHRAFLQQHNGFPALGILAANEVAAMKQNMDGLPEHFLEQPFEASRAGNETTLSREAVQRCWIIAGSRYHAGDQALVPQTLWCPDRDHPFVSLIESRVYDSFRDYLVSTVVQRTVY